MTHSIVAENLVDFVVSQVQSARSSIRLSVHQLTETQVLATLTEMSKQNVLVELLLSNTPCNWINAPYFNQMTACGSKVYMINRKAVHTEHEQDYCLIDSRIHLTRTCRWSSFGGMHETIEIKAMEDEADIPVMQAYDKQFTDALCSYGLIEGACATQPGMYGESATELLREQAQFYYECAVAYLKLNRLSDALDSINEGIRSLPSPNPGFYLLKHTILLESMLFLESTECMYQYFSFVDRQDAAALYQLALTYRNYKNRIREKGMHTVELIGKINQLTCEHLDLFDALNLRPHFFKQQELKLYPF